MVLIPRLLRRALQSPTGEFGVFCVGGSDRFGRQRLLVGDKQVVNFTELVKGQVDVLGMLGTLEISLCFQIQNIC